MFWRVMFWRDSTAGDVVDSSCPWGVSWGQSYEKAQMRDSEARPFICTTRLLASFLYDPTLCSAWPYLTLVPEDHGHQARYTVDVPQHDRQYDD